MKKIRTIVVIIILSLSSYYGNAQIFDDNMLGKTSTEVVELPDSQRAGLIDYKKQRRERLRKLLQSNIMKPD